MAVMFFKHIQKDQNVVQINDNKHVQALSQDVIQECLEGRWCICQPEWHDKVLKVAISRPEHCLPLIALRHVQEVVGTFQIEFREPLGHVQSLQSLHNQWQGTMVLHRELL